MIDVNKLFKIVKLNGIDWYAAIKTDGSVDLKHETALSNILQCCDDPRDYGIVALIQCGHEMCDEEIDEVINQL